MKWVIPYDGRDWVFDSSARVTMHELRLLKRASGGMTPSTLEQARLEGDPDAWLAMLVVARERAGLDTLAALQVDDHRVDMDSCVDATRAANAEPAEKAAEKADGEPRPPRRTRRAKPAADAAEGSEDVTAASA